MKGDAINNNISATDTNSDGPRQTWTYDHLCINHSCVTHYRGAHENGGKIYIGGYGNKLSQNSRMIVHWLVKIASQLLLKIFLPNLF